MRRSHEDVAPAVWRALQTYQRAIPPKALGWYASPDGDMLPLDEQGWEHTRKKMLERTWGAEWRVSLSEDPGEAGGYHFSYDGRKLDDDLFSRDERATSGVSFSFPTEYLLEHGPAHLRALALDLGRELPFSFGQASLAVVSHPGAWGAVPNDLLGLLHRYWGLDLQDLGETSRNIGTGARGAYWLTFLGQPLLGQLGGLEALRQQLAFPEVTFEPMEDTRWLLTLGEWPDVMDTETGTVPAWYRALARQLAPYLREEHVDWLNLHKGYSHGWSRRLCE
ncbi:DUF3396 domain-containing protein [Pyxidicoccus fallax]|uniref:DUF3396 domain-containing protein n=2 Tax=Pyxidicoccus fallax TaxID=394095 RepID=A0A848L6L1_9BACT|nr:DUF3396 domain-containing protein [Pyxidicoccus fallax]NPC77158.1 DUF3396 domain-containing protein [Pyxidicoccus fallax]